MNNTKTTPDMAGGFLKANVTLAKHTGIYPQGALGYANPADFHSKSVNIDANEGDVRVTMVEYPAQPKVWVPVKNLTRDVVAQPASNLTFEAA